MAQYNAFVVVLLLATMIDAEPNVRLCERGVQYVVRLLADETAHQMKTMERFS